MNFVRTPLGSALIAAIGVPLGVLIGASLGWFENPSPAMYAVYAGAGAIGGYIGATIRNRRSE